MDNTFVSFVIGDRRVVHCQANFLTLSLLAHGDASPAVRICVVTDRPEYYRWLREHITVIAVDERSVADWQKPHGYFWRVKLRVMQLAGERCPGNLVYTDADVMCCGRLPEFLAALDAGTPFMHEFEYRLGHKTGKGRRLFRQVAGGRFGPFRVDADNRMWNAGVVALPSAVSRAWLADALECLDSMCAAGIDSPFMEQFALSRSLDRDGLLRPAGQWFHHYWRHKTPWNALIARFLADIQLQQLSVDEACEKLRGLSLGHLHAAQRRSRPERILNSLRKRFFPRDERIARLVSHELTK